MSKVFIISTMTSSVSYCFWDKVEGVKGDITPILREKITIYGGANIPSLKSGFGDVTKDVEDRPMWTAAGIVTTIEAEQYAKLKDHPIFMKHLDGGWVTVTNEDVTGNHKKVKKIVSGMSERDSHAQLTPDTYKQKIKVKTKLLEEETGFRL
jgi:hypothetical protein